MRLFKLSLLFLIIQLSIIPIFIQGQPSDLSDNGAIIDNYYIWTTRVAIDSSFISNFKYTNTGAVIARATTDELRELYSHHIEYMVLNKEQFEALKTGKPINPLKLTKKPAKLHQKVAMIVDNDAYFLCQSKLETYKQDVESYFNTEITIYPGSWPNAESLRQFIHYLWSNNHITGVIQVGYLPYAMWKFPWNEICPLPLFHEDMDGSFIDRNQDGYYDWHIWGANDGPEIWVAYMRPAQGRLSDLLSFLDKCHNYYLGNMSIPKRAEICICHDWWSAMSAIRNSLEPIYGNFISTIGGSGVYVSGQSYLDALANGFEITNVWVHSAPYYHQFDAGPHQDVFDDDVRNLFPGSVFTVMWACHGVDWHESPTNCFAEAYIFGTTNGLADLGATRSIGTPAQEILFDLLGDSTSLADAYTTYLDIVYDSSAISAGYHGDTVGFFVYDVALFGNPFWAPTNQSGAMICLPNGGEFWAGGSNQIIKWNTIGTGYAKQRLLLSTNSGATYSDMVADNILPNDASYSWHVPYLNCTTCRVKVQLLDIVGNVIAEDASDADFSIINMPEGVEVSPNPFVPSRGHTVISFFGAGVPGAIITIINKANESVKLIGVGENINRFDWNAKNDDGKDLASGVYIYIVREKSGASTKGKFAIIR
jgi:hypothetical protein